MKGSTRTHFRYQKLTLVDYTILTLDFFGHNYFFHGSLILKLNFNPVVQNLQKHCDVKEVIEAYEIMREVARHIDQVKKKLEQQTRVKELSGILDGWLGPGE